MTRTGEVVVRTVVGAIVMFVVLAGARVKAAPDDSPKVSVASPRATNTTAVLAWKPRAWAPPAAIAQSVRVASSPVDGALAVPAASEAAPRAAFAAEAPVRIERRSNGMLIAHLDERYAEYMMVTIGADGTPSVTCVHGSQGVASFLKQALVPVATPSPAREDK